MNPLIKSYLDQIDGAVKDLAKNTVDLQEQLAELEESRNELLKDFWGKEKEVSVHKESAKGFSALQTHNKVLEEREKTLRERLAKVLQYTKALTEELRQ